MAHENNKPPHELPAGLNIPKNLIRNAEIAVDWPKRVVTITQKAEQGIVLAEPLVIWIPIKAWMETAMQVIGFMGGALDAYDAEALQRQANLILEKQSGKPT